MIIDISTIIMKTLTWSQSTLNLHDWFLEYFIN